VQLKGATGALALDGFGNVIRTPAWATFNNGHPVPVAGGD
jgi:outer membrane PBP1 activator LpoA protein